MVLMEKSNIPKDLMGVSYEKDWLTPTILLWGMGLGPSILLDS